jgi:nucleoside-diphosphate-sugar epimerase
MEETMTLQFNIQYGLPFTILRSSWVFENDDLLNHFSLLKNVNPAEPGHGFGEQGHDVLELVRTGQEHIPVLLDGEANPFRRHIVHIDDLIHALDRTIDNPKALNETFNIAAPEPFDYRSAANYISSKTNTPTIDIPCTNYHSFEIDITKARTCLDYNPQCNFQTMADRALAYRKSL